MSTHLFFGISRCLALGALCIGGLLAAPTAVNDSYTMSEDGSLSVGGLVLLAANFDQPAPVTFGAQWSYLNNLPNTAGTVYPTDGAGRVWHAGNFDTSTSTVGPWATGAAPFASTQSSQPINYFVNNAVTTTQVLNGLTNVTTYLFRNTFTLTAEEAARPDWTLRYLFDDSAVIWINGQEITRINLPGLPTVITPTTFANNSGNEDTLTDLNVDLTGKLVAGVNTIAVELHQASTLSDAGMQIALLPTADPFGGFGYTGNIFTPTASDFDTGTVDPNTGFNNSGALHVQVGGRTPTNAAVMALSGGFSRTVNVATAGTYSLTFKYRGTATANYDTNEFIEGSCRVDGTRLGTVAADGALAGSGISLFRFVGDGNGGTVPDTGWQEASFNIPLTAGSHTVVLALYNSTSSGSANFPESSDIYFDDVVFGTLGAGIGSGVLVNDTGGTPPVTAVKDTNPANGALTFNSDGSFTYVPAVNFFGIDTFKYHAVDGTGSSNQATVTITVNNVNDTPVAVADSYTFAEDSTLNVNAPGLLANDTDVDGNALTAVVRTQPTHGTLSLNANGSFTYTPDTNYNGTDSFNYRVNDGTVNSGDATVTLTITPVNDPPAGVAESYRTLVNTPLNVNLTSAVGQPTTTVTLVAAGSPIPIGGAGEADLPSWKYLDNGTDQGTAWRVPGFDDSTWASGKAELGYGDDAEGRPERTVVSFGPNSGSKYATTYFRSTFTVVDKSTLSSLKMRLMRDDAAVVYLNGTEIYRDQSANGYPDLPSNPAYNAYSSGSISNTGEQTLEDLTTLMVSNAAQYLTEGNNLLAVEVHQATGGSTDLSFDIELTAQRAPYVGVLANDADPEGSAITAQLITSPSHGTLTLNADGTFLYTPNASYIGPDSFVYRASDGSAVSPGITVSLAVVSIGNAPPAAVDDTYVTPEDTPLNIAAPGVLGNDSDPENDTLTAQILTQPTRGSLTLNANGSFLYTPAQNVNGADSFTYRARDTSLANSAPATVNITVSPVNDPPVAAADSYGTNPGQALTVPAAQGVLANDSDVEGSTLSAVLVAGPASGTLNLNSNGGFTYTPAGGFSGTASFTYRASDGALTSAITTVTIVVNGAPSAGNDSYFTVEDTSLIINAPGVLANDSDPENGALTAVLVAPPAHGTLTLNANGSFSYFPASNYSGTDSFTYRASDGSRTSGIATVTITLTAVDDPPVAQADTYRTTPNVPLTVNAASGVLANDSDAENSPLTAEIVSTTSSGVLSFAADGSFTYTPNFNFAGNDTFVYRVGAGGQFSTNATVTIEVAQPGQDVVINEIMYRSGAAYPENTAEEWLELYNRGTTPINLTGWTIGSGVTYSFPAGRILAPGAYLVVASDPDKFQDNHPGVTNVIGGWIGTLSNSGEKIELVDANGHSQDSVTYSSEGDWATRIRETTYNGWDWSTLANGGGRSIEVQNPQVSNANGQNWVVSSTVGGTPGVANDALTSNIAPIIKSVKHSPAVPKSTDTVVISCELTDEFKDSALQASVFWRDATSTTPGAFAEIAMSVDSNGVWFAPITPKANLTIIEFYISATDGTNTRTWPAPTAVGQVANCQYQVTNEAESGTAEMYRMVFTAAENQSFNNTSSGSNRQFNHTLVVTRGKETSIRYRCDMRTRGASSRSYQFRPMRISIPKDDDLNGASVFNLNPKASFTQYFGMRLAQAVGLRAPDAIPVELRRNGVESTTSSGSTPDYGMWVRMDDVGSEFIDKKWAGPAGAGNAYSKRRPETHWRATATAPTNPDDLLDGAWGKQNNSAANDWSDLTGFFSTWQAACAPHFPGSPSNDVAQGGATTSPGNWDGTAFTAAEIASVETVADLDQWARWFAFMTIVQSIETNISNGECDDYNVYFEPRTINGIPRRIMQLLPHDLDTIFNLGDNRPGATARGLFDMTDDGFQNRELLPLFGNNSGGGYAAFRTKYLTIVREMLGSVFDADTTSNPNPPFYQLVDYHLAGWAPAATRTSIKSFMTSRRTYLLGLIGQGAIAPTAGTANATVTSAHGALVIHEVLANNASAYNNGGLFPDVVEIRNTGAVSIDLAGKSLTDDPLQKAKYVFPAGTTLAAGAIMVLHADADLASPGVHLGFGLNADGDAVYLYDTVGAGQTLLDSVVFGLQVPDLSIGRTGAALDTWTLCSPTVGAANTAVATLASPAAVKINEFLGNADYLTPDDFIELYNPGAQPVALGGMRFTDDPINFPAKNLLPPLSFMGAGAFVAFEAKGGSATPGNARELNFNIDSNFGEVALYGANAALIDRIETVSQFRDVSVGRLPDGSTALSRLSPPSPGSSNAVLAENVSDVLNYLRITEIMFNPASSAGSEYIEFRNMSDTAAIPVTLQLGGVQFTNGITYSFPPGATLAPGQYFVIVESESKFNAQFPGVPVGGVYSGKLDNGGERLRFEIANGSATVLDFSYNDSWYPSTDAGGDALQIVDGRATPSMWDKKEGWQATTPNPGAGPSFGVDAGPGSAVAVGAPAYLDGAVYPGAFDPAGISVAWTKDAGPGTVTFTTGTYQDANARFSQAGVYTLRFTATATGGATASDTVQITVAESYAAWAARVLSGQSVANQAALADPDRDGISNLAEFTFGSDPLVSGSSSLPTVSIVNDHLVMAWTRSRFADPSIEVVPQIGGDLAAWLEGASNIPAVMVNQTTTTEQWEAVDPQPVSSQIRRFLRAKITLP